MKNEIIYKKVISPITEGHFVCITKSNWLLMLRENTRNTKSREAVRRNK